MGIGLFSQISETATMYQTIEKNALRKKIKSIFYNDLNANGSFF